MSASQLLSRSCRLFARLAAARRATAAIEFALVVPVLAGIAITLPDLCNAAAGAINMEAAVRAGIQYAMNGGADMTLAQQIGTQSWKGMPQDASLTASQSCVCDSGGGICGQLCPDGSIPAAYVTVSASATLGGSVISFPGSSTQTVRIR
ncbi:MAG: hypothetical protein KGJ79_09345 [Alphaproteobacteria bacterium]|nr:hypothetical protein [Alphaproteobacteria bacterium]MDE2111334.1 hypothetical protein [Alphaproteobacteria bacterium]MDE2495613.1 hypothetical protein [Alphaproteobacteria bacterium]